MDSIFKGGMTQKTLEDLAREWAHDAAKYRAAHWKPAADRTAETEAAAADLAGAVVDSDTVTLAIAAGDYGRAIGLAHDVAGAAMRRLEENEAAQAEGRADVFGADPDARHTSWAGRYDGAF